MSSSYSVSPGEASPEWITPDWPAPPNVHAVSTTRVGGVSTAPFDSLNLGVHVGDDRAAVDENRRRLRTALNLDAEPLWLSQVHGVNVVDANSESAAVPEADASVCKGSGRACVIMTADCLPILFCDREGTSVAATHAGWRGLGNGVVSATVAAMGLPGERLMAWLGPAIEQSAFEVGSEVRELFITRHPQAAAAFAVNERGRWQADLYALARLELAAAGVQAVYGGTYRSHQDSARFFSYRRDGKTGRMATLVWIARAPGGAA